MQIEIVVTRRMSYYYSAEKLLKVATLCAQTKAEGKLQTWYSFADEIHTRERFIISYGLNKFAI